MSHTSRLFRLLFVPLLVFVPFVSFAVETVELAAVEPERLAITSEQNAEVLQKATVVATTDIRDAQIVAQQGRALTILFSLYNATGVQSGIVYGVELYASGKLVDVVAFTDQPLTLGAGESHPVSFTYEAPAFLSGSYDVWVVAKTVSGMPLSLFKVGTVSLQATAAGVELSDCVLRVAGETFSLTQGVDVSAEESLEMSCVAQNQTAQPIDVGPQFTTFERSVYGPQVETELPIVQSVTLPVAKNTPISFAVPKATQAQAYDVVLQLVDTKGAIVSTKVAGHYVVQGASATVQNVVFDKSAYGAGEVAEVMITWSLAADAFSGARGTGTTLPALSLSIALADSTGAFCSNPTVVSIENGSTVTQAQVPVVSQCNGPQVLVGIATETGARLAAQSYDYAPVVVETELTAPTTVAAVVWIVLGIVVAIAVLLVVAVRLLTYILKTKRVAMPVAFVEPTAMTGSNRSSGVTLGAMLLAVGIGAQFFFTVGVNPVAALTLNVASGMDTITFTVNTNKSTYTVSEPVQVFGASFVTGCGNSIADGGLEAQDGTGAMQTIGTFDIGPFSGFGMFDRTVTGYNSVGTKSMLTRGYVQAGLITNSAIGHLPLTVTCGSNATWNGTSCVSSDPAPTATIEGVGCEIATGENTCVANIDWNIANAATPSVRNVTTNTIYSYNATGNDEPRTIVYGTNVIAAFNAASILDTTAVTGFCESGSQWNGTVCAAIAAPSATIAATSCEIPLGSSNCGVAINWNISAATAPNVYNNTTNTVYASALAGVDVPQTIPYGTHTLQARDGVSVLNDTTASATCASGTWNGAVCAATNGLSLTFTANGDETTTTIMQGESVTLTWETTGMIDECVAGADWSGVKAVDGTEVVTNITSNRFFTITCTGPVGTIADEVTVITTTLANLIPAGLSLTPSSVFNSTTGMYESLYVQYSVTNDGGVATPAFMNRLSLDRFADGSYEQTVESATAGGLAVGADSPLFPVLIATNVPFGTHRLRLNVDNNNVVTESNESDNEQIVTIAVPVPDPGLEFRAEPTVVRSGQSTKLSWDTNATFPMNCTVRGPQVAHTFNPSIAGPTGQKTTGALTAKSEFRLQCTVGDAVFTKTAWVEVIPGVQEI